MLRCRALTRKSTRCKRRLSRWIPYCKQHTETILGVTVKESLLRDPTGEKTGNGLFATRPFTTKEKIAETIGVRTENQPTENDYLIQTQRDTWIDQGDKSKSSITRYANDTLPYNSEQGEGTNNCEAMEYKDGSVYLVATRDIQPGEEITWSYGDAYWSPAEREGFFFKLYC